MTGNNTAHSPLLSHAEDKEIDLRAVLNLLKHSYKLILLITALFLSAGIYYAATRQPVFRSTALMEVKSSNMSSILGVASAHWGGGAPAADIEKTLLRTPYILGDAVRQLGFDIAVFPHYSGFFEKRKIERKNQVPHAKISILSVPNILLGKKLRLVIKTATQYDLLSPDNHKILSGVVGQLTQATYAGELIKIQVDQLHGLPGAQLTTIKQPVLNVAISLGNSLNIHPQGTTGVLQLTYTSSTPEQAQKILNTVLFTALKRDQEQKALEADHMLQFLKNQLPILQTQLEATQNKINAYGVKTGIFNIKNTEQMLSINLMHLQESLQKMKTEKNILLTDFTSRHPLVIAENEREAQIKNQIADTQSVLNKVPFTAEKEAALLRDLTIQEKLYLNMLDSMQKMQMMKAGIVSNVRILDQASYPTAPLKIKTSSIILASLILGLMTGVSIVFVRHVLSPVIEDPDVVERALGIPVFAIISYSQKQMSHTKLAARNLQYANSNPYLLALKHPKDFSIEGLRSLRTAVQMLLLEATDNVIAITGCGPSVGKSFVSSNLAVLLSDLNKRVLIIDSDIRLGKLHHTFGKLKSPGLSTFLQNEAKLEHIIQTVIPGKLDVITAGAYPNSPSELLSQNSFSELMTTLKSKYDLVIIDTPPILAVTDPALILRYSSTNLIVIGVGKDQMKEVQHAKSVLEKAGVKLTGMVFNHIKQHKAGFGYGYQYGYGKYNYYYAYDK